MSNIIRHLVDTDKILDRCAECGERARYIERTDDALAFGVECSECPTSIDFQESMSKAMVTWNKAQRLSKK